MPHLLCCAAGPLTTEDFFLMQLHAERAQFATEAVKVVERALEEGRCRLAGELPSQTLVSGSGLLHCLQSWFQRRLSRSLSLPPSAGRCQRSGSSWHHKSYFMARLAARNARYEFLLKKR